jgi:DUF1680 family protein
VRGQIAVERGPLVLALEDVDLPAGLDVEQVVIDTTVRPSAHPDGAVATFRHRAAAPAAWPFGSIAVSEGEPLEATLIPYYRWANRGPSTMRVWIPTLA